MDLRRIASRLAAEQLTYKVECEEAPFGHPSLRQSVSTVSLVRSDGAKIIGTLEDGKWSSLVNETDLSDDEAAAVLSKAREQFPQGGGGNWKDVAGGRTAAERAKDPDWSKVRRVVSDIKSVHSSLDKAVREQSVDELGSALSQAVANVKFVAQAIGDDKVAAAADKLSRLIVERSVARQMK